MGPERVGNSHPACAREAAVRTRRRMRREEPLADAATRVTCGLSASLVSGRGGDNIRSPTGSAAGSSGRRRTSGTAERAPSQEAGNHAQRRWPAVGRTCRRAARGPSPAPPAKAIRRSRDLVTPRPHPPRAPQHDWHIPQSDQALAAARDLVAPATAAPCHGCSRDARRARPGPG